MKNRFSTRALRGLVSVGLFVVVCFLVVAALENQGSAAEKPLHIIVFGAHPDDCEFDAGGVAAKWAKLGHKVKFVSVTNGDIGHTVIAGGPLAQRRTKEVQDVAKILGIETQVLDNHDGELMPTLENRKTIIRLIREWKADLVITHRPNDYHPDHRYTSILVQDAAYMVTVPFICPDTPQLKSNPVFMYSADGFQKPNPFKPDVVVSIDDVYDQTLSALDCLASQIYEYGAGGDIDPNTFIKGDKATRMEWLRKRMDGRFRAREGWKPLLEEFYGKEAAASVKHVQAFELCEYGDRPSKEELKNLFPFFTVK